MINFIWGMVCTLLVVAILTSSCEAVKGCKAKGGEYLSRERVCVKKDSIL
jgi:hypothetical protein